MTNLFSCDQEDSTGLYKCTMTSPCNGEGVVLPCSVVKKTRDFFHIKNQRNPPPCCFGVLVQEKTTTLSRSE
jgi:hypothetical protein